MELIHISCPLTPENKAVLLLNTLVCPYVAFKREILKITCFSDTCSNRRFHRSTDTLDWAISAPLLTVYSVLCPLSAGEAAGEALWPGGAPGRRGVGGGVGAQRLGEGCAQHGAPPACPALPLLLG